MLPGEQGTLEDFHLPSWMACSRKEKICWLPGTWGEAHAGASPGSWRYQLQHVAWEAVSWLHSPKLISRVPAHVLLLWQSWEASSEFSAASLGHPAALSAIPSWMHPQAELGNHWCDRSSLCGGTSIPQH